MGGMGVAMPLVAVAVAPHLSPYRPSPRERAHPDSMGIRAPTLVPKSVQKPHHCCLGGVAERSNAAVLKTAAASAPSGVTLHFLRKIRDLMIASSNEMHGSASAWLSPWLSASRRTK
jgi:hypothetical protein